MKSSWPYCLLMMEVLRAFMTWASFLMFSTLSTTREGRISSALSKANSNPSEISDGVKPCKFKLLEQFTNTFVCFFQLQVTSTRNYHAEQFFSTLQKCATQNDDEIGTITHFLLHHFSSKYHQLRSRMFNLGIKNKFNPWYLQFLRPSNITEKLSNSLKENDLKYSHLAHG